MSDDSSEILSGVTSVCDGNSFSNSFPNTYTSDSSSDSESDDEVQMNVEAQREELNVEERIMLEEYKIWKNNCPHLYDLILTHTLEWPSLTVQWLPDYHQPEGKDYTVQRFILGTRTNENYPNYLMLAEFRLPLLDSEEGEEDWDSTNQQNGVFESSDDKIRIVKMITHKDEVNMARYMPQNPSIIATKTGSEEVFVFDTDKHRSRAYHCNPDLRLFGHDNEGFSLSWNIFKPGHLISGGDDSLICLWDINAPPTHKTLEANRVFKVNNDCVEEVAWHMKNQNLFGSVGGNNLHIWDTRSASSNHPAETCIAHPNTVNCLAFNPLNESTVITGSSDTNVKLWDLRKIGSGCVHTFHCNSGEVFNVEWNKKEEYIFGSGCHGRRVMVWDIDRIGQEQTPMDAEDGPPELLFVHGGHTGLISDISWNPSDEWLVASVADDNIIHIWNMSEGIYKEYDDDYD